MIRSLPLLLAALGSGERPVAPGVQRQDLARAVAQVDACLAAGAPAEEVLVRASDGFDRASLAFFALDLRGALGELATLRADLAGWTGAERDQELAGSALRIEPAARWTTAETVDVALVPLFPVPALAERTVRVALRDRGQVVATTEVPFDAAGWPAPVALPSIPLPADGEVRLSLSRLAGGSASVAACTRLARAPEELRAEVLERLADLPEGAPTPRRVLAARAELLCDAPSPERTHEFLVDSRALASELAAEVQALEQGADPYVERPGHLWRPLHVGRRALALRIYAPPSVAGRDEPVPVVVAFHGAGADESFFVELRGICDLVGEADARGFLLVCPRTPDWFYGTAAWTALVDELDRSYGVDRARVFALGHSMGAACVGTLVKAGATPLAGAALLAGAGDPGETDVPLVFVAGERDPLAPPERVRAAAQRCGADVLVVPARGHTFLLAAGLEHALDRFGLTR